MTDERAAKFEKLFQHTKEAISDLCGMKVEDLEKHSELGEIARTMASMIATIRAFELNDISELPPLQEFEAADLFTTAHDDDKYLKVIGSGTQKREHVRAACAAMSAAQGEITLDYSVTIILHHIGESKTCTLSTMDNHTELSKLLKAEASFIDGWLRDPPKSSRVH